ncbi:MAG: tetratricopeptide repeat protein [Methylobacter sp.]|nr:tetratricopeptide repeat protein [Methylobacter sp.]
MNDKYQDFLSKLQNADESERDWLVMEFSLQNLSETLRQAVWAAAIPHWFDRDFLNAVLTNPLKDSDFQALTELSFVEVYPERGFNVHERSRNLLLTQLWATNKTRYQKLSKRAAAYCKKQDQSVTAWRVETIYHSLLADNLRAKDDFIKQGLEWHDSFQFDKLESLIQIVLEAENGGKLTRETGDIVGYAHSFQAAIDIRYYRHESAIKHLKFALTQKTQSKVLKADCFLDLGRVHYCLGEYIQARNCYQQALTIYQRIKDGLLGKANCIELLGMVHMLLAEYRDAQDCFQQALHIFQQIENHLGEANCTRALGDIHRHLAEYNQALDYYQKTLPIYKQIKSRLGEANYFKNLGVLQGAQLQPECAIASIQHAAQIYEEIGIKRCIADCFDDLATIYQRQKQFELALAAFNQAINIFPDDVAWYQSRAVLCMQLDDYEKAEVDIKQAEIIGTNVTCTLLRKAELALWQQQTAQAVEFCQQALEQRPADGNFRAFFALTLLAHGQAQTAYTEMELALAAIYEQHDFDDLLDDLDKLAKIYGHSADVDNLREQILNRCQK